MSNYLAYGVGPAHSPDVDKMPPPPTEEIPTWPKLKSSQAVRHDYEPGDDTHPMHTDPLCIVCGQPKKHPDHS